MNLKSFKKYFHDELKDLYSLEELDSLFFILINYYLQISKIAYIQNPQKQLNKLNGPVGLSIEAKTPSEIAISIISQIILFKNTVNA